MTAKEVAIKLFKLKMPISEFHIDLRCGHITHGVKIVDSNIVYIVGISTASNVLKFNSIIFELDTHEYVELKKIYEDRKLSLEFEKSEKIKIQQKTDFEILSEVASKENFDISRRVLTEKHTNFKF